MLLGEWELGLADNETGNHEGETISGSASIWNENSREPNARSETEDQRDEMIIE